MSNIRNSPPTIYNVAKLSGLSIATICRVINSPERVSESNGVKVIAAIDELGFVPSAEARPRAGQSTGQIGVITSYFTSPSFTDRLRGVAAILANSRYELVAYTVDSIDRLNGYLSALPIRVGWIDRDRAAGGRLAAMYLNAHDAVTQGRVNGFNAEQGWTLND